MLKASASFCLARLHRRLYFNLCVGRLSCYGLSYVCAPCFGEGGRRVGELRMHDGKVSEVFVHLAAAEAADVLMTYVFMKSSRNSFSLQIKNKRLRNTP